jgi:hypothetical protein
LQFLCKEKEVIKEAKLKAIIKVIIKVKEKGTIKITLLNCL